MRLIQSIVALEPAGVWAWTVITAESAFVEGDRVSSVLGLEYLAQAAAAYFSLQSRDTAQPVRQGMLVACPRLEADVPWFAVGAGLLLHVRAASRLPTVEQGRGLVRFSGVIHLLENGQPVPETLPAEAGGVLRAELSVYL